MIDVDNFKRLNDQFGHSTGDRVLVALVTAARAEMRKSDEIGRWGGDEFLLVAPHGPAEVSSGAGCPLFQRIAERFRCLVATPADAAIPATLSIGVAWSNGLESMDDLVERIDQALYRAKELGRDRIVVAGSPRPESAS